MDPLAQVPEHILNTLAGNGAKIVLVNNATMAKAGFGMNWRFLVADNKSVNRFVIRDCDSRLLLRDRYALDEWEQSKLPYHVVRDHVAHSSYPISGGMWGAVTSAPTPNMLALLSQTRDKQGYMHDMNFLNQIIWPIMAKSGVRQHDAFSCTNFAAQGLSSGWPIMRGGAEHVGAVYETADQSRASDIAILPRHDTCAAPAYQPSLRRELFLGKSSLNLCLNCTELPTRIDVGKLEKTTHKTYEVQYMFVDSLSNCSMNGTLPDLPTLFNFSDILRWPLNRRICSPPASDNITNFYTRVKFPLTHFDVFKPRGIEYARLLFISDAVFRSDKHELIAEGLPTFAFILSQMPSTSKVLLPHSAETEALVVTAARLGVTWNSSRVSVDGWESANWVALHLPAPSMWWAFRSVVVTTEAPRLALLPRLGSSFVHAHSNHIAGRADTNFAASAHLIAISLPVVRPRLPCILAVAQSSSLLHHAVTGANGWQVVQLNDSTQPEDWAETIATAGAVVVEASRPPIFLGLVNPVAYVFFVHGNESFKYLRMCSLPSGPRCIHEKITHIDNIYAHLKPCQHL